MKSQRMNELHQHAVILMKNLVCSDDLAQSFHRLVGCPVNYISPYSMPMCMVKLRGKCVTAMTSFFPPFSPPKLSIDAQWQDQPE